MTFLSNNTRDDLNGFYFGIVEDNTDIDNLGRIRVRIDELHGTPKETPTEALPLCGRLDPVMFGTSDNIGIYSIPTIGSKVAVMFHRGDLYNPFYFASPYTSKKIDEEQNPNLVFYKDPAGNKIKTDLTTGDVSVDLVNHVNLTVAGDNTNTVSGNFTLNVTGNTTITTQGNTSIKTEGNTDIETTGNTNIKSEGNISVEAMGNLDAKAATVNVESLGTTTVKSAGVTTIEASAISINKGSVTIEKGATNCFTCLPSCLFTGANHNTNTSI